MSTVEELKSLGNQAFSAKNYQKAIELYTDAIEMDPKNHTLYSNRSGAYCAAGKYRQAQADANKVTQIKPDWVRGYTRLGAALEGLEDWEGATKAYEDALKLDSSNADIRADLDHARSKINAGPQGNPGMDPMAQLSQLFSPQAFDTLKYHPTTAAFFRDPSFVEIINKIKADPKNMSAYMSDKRVEVCMQVLLEPLMKQFSDKNGPKDAQSEEIETIPEEPTYTPPKPEPKKPEPKKPEPKKPEPSNNQISETEKALGNECFKNGDIEGAIIHYDKAIEVDPFNVLLHSNKASCLIRQKKYQEAVDICSKAIEAGREHHADFESIAKAYTKIASAEAARDNLDAAISALNSSILEKKDPVVKRELKRLQDLKIKRDAAAYENPELADKAKNEGNACFRNNDFPTAIEHYNEAIKRSPRSAPLYSNRAAAYSKLGEMPMAIKDCEKAIELDPNFARAYTRKAYCHYVMKENHKAIDCYNEALKIDPDNAEALDGLQTVNQAIAKARFTAPDENQIRHAMADPEIQKILQDPGMQQILRDLQENPSKAQTYMADPNVRQAFAKLQAAGVLR